MRSPIIFYVRCLVILAGGSMVATCSSYSHMEKTEAPRRAYFQGRTSEAAAGFLELAQSSDTETARNRHLFQADLGQVRMTEGKGTSSLGQLAEARPKFVFASEQQGEGDLAAFVTQGKSDPYWGLDHEKLALRVNMAMLALGTGNLSEAENLGCQAAESVDRAIRDAAANPKLHVSKEGYRRLGLGYLIAAIASEENGQIARARSYLEKALRLEENRFARTQLERLNSGAGYTANSGQGAVWTFILAGEGPHQSRSGEALAISPDSVALRLATNALVIGGTKWSISAGTYPVPSLVTPPWSGAEFRVWTPEAAPSAPELVCDYNAIARNFWDISCEEVYAGALVRYVVLKALAKTVDSQVGFSLGEQGFFETALDLVTASIPVDSRCLSVLPARMFVSRLELPAGARTVKVTAQMPGSASRTIEAPVQVHAGYASFVVVSWPVLGSEMRPIVSDQPRSTPPPVVSTTLGGTPASSNGEGSNN